MKPDLTYEPVQNYGEIRIPLNCTIEDKNGDKYEFKGDYNPGKGKINLKEIIPNDKDILITKNGLAYNKKDLFKKVSELNTIKVPGPESQKIYIPSGDGMVEIDAHKFKNFIDNYNPEKDKHVIEEIAVDESKNDKCVRDPIKKKLFFKEKYKIMENVNRFRPILKGINTIFEMGAKKYKLYQWELTADREHSSTFYCSYDAAIRHLLLVLCGVEYDKESGLPHLCHAACRCLMMCLKDLSETYNLVHLCKENVQLLGVNEHCILGGNDLGYIPAAILITLMKFDRMDKKYIDRYMNEIYGRMYTDDGTGITSDEAMTATARYLLSLMLELKQYKSTMDDILNEVADTEEIFLSVLYIINKFIITRGYLTI